MVGNAMSTVEVLFRGEGRVGLPQGSSTTFPVLARCSTYWKA